MCRNFVAYFRVSTEKQGKSGLGLEAQQAAVAAFIASKGADARLMASFTEVESGKRNDRRELAKAMERARLIGGHLLIAKLDRLSRNAAFLLGLKEAGVSFTACDMPDANNLTIGIMSLVAQQEREAISTRTKEALKAAKARGQKLGNPNGAKHLRRFGNALAVDAIKAGAKERADGLAATFADLRAEGFTSANALAGALNARGYAAPRGGKWTARSVLNVEARLG